VTGIILKYRVPRRPDEPKGEPARRPLQDAQRAVSLVRSKAGEWGINPERIGIVGFSAGGHLAIATATSFDKRTYEPIDDVDKVSCRPDFAIRSIRVTSKRRTRMNWLPACVFRPDAADLPRAWRRRHHQPTGEQCAHVPRAKACRRAAELHIYAGTAHDFGVRSNDRHTQLGLYNNIYSSLLLSSPSNPILIPPTQPP
jgi:acetyl esterase/lipase